MYQVINIFKPLLLLIDILGYAFFWWFKLKRFPEPKKILCVRIDHIGDVLLTTPAFRALRNRFPKARVDVLVRSMSKQVLEGNKNVDRIVVFDAPWLGIHGKNAGWKEVPRFVKKLRKENYDLVFDFHADPRNILLAFLVGKYRVGFGIRGFGFLLNKVVRFKKRVQHQIQYNLDLVRSVGADASPEMDFPIPSEAKRKAKSLLKPAKKSGLVMIAPAAGKRKYKYWISSRWALVADALIERYGVMVVLAGSPEDVNDSEEIILAMKNKDKVINTTGKTSLKVFGAMLQQCKLLLSPDSAPAHIARALKTPLLELFSGKENPKRWGYDEGKFRHLQKQSTKSISVSEVLAAVANLGVFDEE